MTDGSQPSTSKLTWKPAVPSFRISIERRQTSVMPSSSMSRIVNTVSPDLRTNSRSRPSMSRTPINTVFSGEGINITGQYLQTNADVGYVVIDVEQDDSSVALQQLQQIEATIRTRLLF